jgi:hypothetical protein
LIKTIDGLPLQYADDCSIISHAPNDIEMIEKQNNNCRKITSWLKKWRLKANCSKTDAIWFNGREHQMLISGESINIATQTTVLGLQVDRKLKFTGQREIASGVIYKKFCFLQPFLHAGLRPSVAKKIFTTVILAKALHNAFIWDPEGKVPIHKYMKDVLGASLNPPTESLYRILDLYPQTIRNQPQLFSICRMTILDGSIKSILERPERSLHQNIRSCLGKLLGRQFQVNELSLKSFTKTAIKNLLKSETLNRWITNLRCGLNSTGLLGLLKYNHLQENPYPLHITRHESNILVGLLTGHTALQYHLYDLGLTYTPTCTCLEDDETVHHYLFDCKNYQYLRKRIKLDPTKHQSILQFAIASGRFDTT